jgi:hypothetical protein
MIGRFLTRLCARHLGRRSHLSEHERILAKAREIRRSLGMPDDKRLGRA